MARGGLIGGVVSVLSGSLDIAQAGAPRFIRGPLAEAGRRPAEPARCGGKKKIHSHVTQLLIGQLVRVRSLISLIPVVDKVRCGQVFPGYVSIISKLVERRDTVY